MAPMEVEVTVTSAKDLKNVNWRHGDLKPYAVVWVDPNAKCSTNVDNDGDTCPVWDETLVVPVNCPVDEAILSIDIVHANAPEDTKPLIGSARIPVKEIVDEVGFGEKIHRTLQLARPSGRPQGKLQVKIKVRDSRYRAPAPAYGVPPPSVSREYYPPPYGYPPQAPPTAVPPSGYPYSGPPPPPPVYGQPGYVPVEEKKSGFGMGTGVAVGAVAGVLGGIALSEGIEAAENNIAEEAAEKVEEDMAYEAAYEASYDDDY